MMATNAANESNGIDGQVFWMKLPHSQIYFSREEEFHAISLVLETGAIPVSFSP